jgi:hypothetical protein
MTMVEYSQADSRANVLYTRKSAIFCGKLFGINLDLECQILIQEIAKMSLVRAYIFHIYAFIFPLLKGYKYGSHRRQGEVQKAR